MMGSSAGNTVDTYYVVIKNSWHVPSFGTDMNKKNVYRCCKLTQSYNIILCFGTKQMSPFITEALYNS